MPHHLLHVWSNTFLFATFAFHENTYKKGLQLNTTVWIEIFLQVKIPYSYQMYKDLN